MYSKTVMDHFKQPRNVGVIEDADGVGEVGNPLCGDMMTIYLKIEDETIKDIKFQTFGCGSAVATSSMITELVMGKTLDEALEVTRADVADALDGLPPIKMHCSNLAADALHDAIKNWRSGKKLAPLGAEEIAAAGAGCGAHGATVIEGLDEYAGKGLYKSVDDPSALTDKRVLVIDKGVPSAKLALELTKVTPRVVFATELETLGLPADVATEVKHSDVKTLFRSRLLAVRGEGEVERALIHDLDEDSEYELFVDAVVLLEA